MKRVFGVFVLVLGLLLAGWIAFNLLVEMQPEAAGRNPLPGIGLSAAFIFVGVRWIQNKSA